MAMRVFRIVKVKTLTKKRILTIAVANKKEVRVIHQMESKKIIKEQKPTGKFLLRAEAVEKLLMMT